MILTYASKNLAKIDSMQQMLKNLPIDIKALPQMLLENPLETGTNPLENSIIKARSYYSQLKIPLFSCDSALIFENVDTYDQPGVLIRRLANKSMSDKEMIEVYSKIASRYGGRITAHYENAICLIVNEEEVYSYDGENIYSEKFYIVETPHHYFKSGFPLDSLSVDINSGKYYYDIEQTNNLQDSKIAVGFRSFF